MPIDRKILGAVLNALVKKPTASFQRPIGRFSDQSQKGMRITWPRLRGENGLISASTRQAGRVPHRVGSHEHEIDVVC